jgi:DNA mismatch repair protein MutS2
MGDRERFVKEIKGLLVKYASTSSGEKAILSLRTDYERAIRDFKLISEVLREYSEGRSLSLPNIPSMDEIFDYFGKFGVLTGENLYTIAEFIEKTSRFRESLHSANLASYLPITRELLSFSKQIKDNISRDGQIRTVKNPLLKELYEKRNEVREQLLKAYSEIILKNREKLREGQPVIKNGRLTLPVISNFSFDGVIHGYSYTTETIFVEPYEVVPIQNRLIQLDDRIREEERRILGNLVGNFIRLKEGIIKLHEGIGLIDGVYARAKFYLDFDCTIPEFSKDGRFEILEGREPLLYSKIRQKTVPISIKLDKFALLITGPNAGGKTITLRTIAFAVLMAGMGIPVPAKKAVIPYGAEVFPMGFSQEGAPEEGISHFVGELKGIKGILERVKQYDFVIFDEIFSSTDPDEASALAYSICKYLSERSVYSLISTHFPSLKILALNSDFFNVATLENFRVVMGKVGESRGIQTARAVGLTEDIVSYAEEIYRNIPSYLVSLRERYEEGLKKIERERAEIEEMRRKLLSAISRVRKGERVEELEGFLKEERELEVGKEYFVKSLGVKGTLLEIKGNRAKVKIRNIVVDVDKGDLI